MTMISIPLTLTLVAVFVAVGLGAGYAASLFLSDGATARTRLHATPVSRQITALPELLSVSAQNSLGKWKGIAAYLPRSEKDLHKLRQRLARAGYASPEAAIYYTLIETIGPFIVGAVPLFFLSGQAGWLAAAAAAIFTFMTPGLVVGQMLARRRKEIENGLPDALDLLVVCIEAGSGIDQAIVKAGEELAITYPSLSGELRVLTMEVRAGKSRLEAFKNLAQRTKIDDVRALVAMLIQTDKFGTSIGQALRTHAEISRTKRRQRAEERAAKIGVKLVFPLVLLFFPAFFIVVLGPAIIQFVHQFMSN